jgi:hypothetical protein
MMGQAFDVTGSYEALLVRLALATFAVGTLMLLLPKYPRLSGTGIMAAAPRPVSTSPT